MIDRLKLKIFKILATSPYFSKLRNRMLNKLGVKGEKYRFAYDVKIVGRYNYITMGNESEVNSECFLLLKDQFILGENSTLAYQVCILTSANPNGPHNKLVKLYP